jgi:2-oxoglutarate dehydrogenase E2 component (dihydrolipoamide succinyltransferase)
MPRLGESVTEGTVDKWLKRQGDVIQIDDPIVEIVTDKLQTEVTSPFAGILARVLVAEGSTVAVGTVLAEIETVEGP